MNYINEFNIEPGTYTDESGNVFVVVDVVNYAHNTAHNMPEAITDPWVILRHLSELKEHKRYAYPLSLFKAKFHKK